MYSKQVEAKYNCTYLVVVGKMLEGLVVVYRLYFSSKVPLPAPLAV